MSNANVSQLPTDKLKKQRSTKGKAIAPIQETDSEVFTYEDKDTLNTLPNFTPSRPPGPQIHQVLRNQMSNAEDFFLLFFSNEMIETICENINKYAWLNIHKKPYYGDKNGAWIETNPDEMKKLIALLLYQGMVKVPTLERYWSQKSLYHGLWAREFMSRDRFKALLAFLHIVDPSNEKENDKLKKIRPYIDSFRQKCKELYEPDQNMAIDEQLVKSKHRSGIRQFIKDKPAKFGIKLWVIAESKTGYTWDFDVYAGKAGSDLPTNDHGLGYNVVMKLTEPLLNQGYQIYFDNFYTSSVLVKALYLNGTPSCGTVTENRKGFPKSMKGGKIWARKRDRGEMRWLREDDVWAVQWIDNKVVTMLSTIDCGNEYVSVKRLVKTNDKWERKDVRQPFVVHRYNQFMNAVDKSDQYLAKYNMLRKCIRWWKTLFFHLIDIAAVNGFILFDQLRKADPTSLLRNKKYSVLEFREEVIRNLAGINEYASPPVFKPFVHQNTYHSDHVPHFGDKRNNCKVCYQTLKKECKVSSFCPAPQCQVFLHCSVGKNCFAVWHDKTFH